MNTREPDTLDDQEATLLLRHAGAREEPSRTMAEEVFQTTHTAWQAMLTRRRRHRHMAWGISAALAASILLTVLLYRSPAVAPPPQVIGQVARVEGRLTSASAPGGPWVAQPQGAPISTGQVLVTGADDRAALALAAGVSVRIDHDSQVALVATDILHLQQGALYIDAEPGNQHPLTIQTTRLAIRHRGTQYSVRIIGKTVDIAIREGQVQIDDGTTIHTGDARQRLQLDENGRLSRSPLPAVDSYWEWTQQIAPVFDIEGRTLADFLQWAARETGKPLVYVSDAARISAGQVRLSGSIAALDIDTALSSVLASTQLRQDDRRTDELHIALVIADSSD